MEHQEKIVGILGGIGPEATATLFMKIIKSTPVKKDQDHLRIVIDNNPKIPNRTLAILGRGKSPLKQLQETLHNLEKAGAEIIAMPCNTAHYNYSELQESTNLPIINIISETIAYIRQNFPDIKRVGLLASAGVMEAGIYHKAVGKLELIIPDENEQRIVVKAIHGIKIGTRRKPRSNILTIAKALVEKGAEAIIAGCTEIPLVLNQKDLSVPLIDTLQVLASAVVREASKRTR